MCDSPKGPTEGVTVPKDHSNLTGEVTILWV